MSHFSKIELVTYPNLFVVVDVIVADQAFIDAGLAGDPNFLIKTSYNTYGNVHYAPSPPALPYTPDEEPPFRANYGGVGFTFDTSYTINNVEGVFYAPQPYPSWTLNTQTFLWEAPVPYPATDESQGAYFWNEADKKWQLVA
jgi:hypothetical protein